MLRLMHRAFEAGHELALHDAIAVCHETKRSLPDWAMAELAKRSRSIARGEKFSKKRGRHAVPSTEQEQLLDDANCHAEVCERRLEQSKFPKGEDAFSMAGNTLGRDRETVRKAFRRHRDRVEKGNYYVSWAYCDGDVVKYLQHNQELLGW